MPTEHEITVLTLAQNIGKEITALELKDNALWFTFFGGTKMRIWDDKLSCCEKRYMTTDDKLSDFIGATLLTSGIAPVSYVDLRGNYGDTHEIQFLQINTCLGAFTIETHNRHNGYYGGFNIRCEATE